MIWCPQCASRDTRDWRCGLECRTARREDFQVIPSGADYLQVIATGHCVNCGVVIRVVQKSIRQPDGVWEITQVPQ